MRSPLALGLGVVGLCGCGLVVTLALNARPIPASRLPFVVTQVPAEQNGWPLLRQAGEAVQRPPLGTTLPTPSLATANDPRSLALLARNADALRLADQALAFPRIQLTASDLAPQPAPEDPPQWAAGLRGLARIYELRSLACLGAGDEAGAWRDAGRALQLGRAVQGLGGPAVPHLSGIVAEMIGLRAVVTLAGPGEETLSADRRAELDRLLRLCLDERDVQPAFARSLAAERRWLATDAVAAVDRESRTGDLFDRATAPVLFDRCEFVQRIERNLLSVEAASHRPTWPGSPGLSSREPLYWPFQHNPAGRWMAGIMEPVQAKWLRRTYQLRAQRRLTGTVLALRLYQDRHGRLPETLAALVGDGLLPAVPQDPFGGAALHYRAGDGLVYSIGINGRDDGGVHDTRPAGSQDTTPLVHDDAVVRLPRVPAPGEASPPHR